MRVIQESTTERVIETDHAARLPENAQLLGSYQDFELHQVFVPEARFSARTMVYIYAMHKDSGVIAFTQVTAIHRRAVGSWTPEDIERRLTIDALSRAKHRIADDSYTPGQAYTVELDDYDLE